MSRKELLKATRTNVRCVRCCEVIPFGEYYHKRAEHEAECLRCNPIAFQELRHMLAERTFETRFFEQYNTLFGAKGGNTTA